jgi:hypothetical protein
VLIVASNTELSGFCDQMYGYLEAGVQAHGGSIATTSEQFRKYCVTALKVRVEKVIRPKWRALGYDFTGMDVSSGWALPTPMHDVLSSVGTARLGVGEIDIFPIWDKQADALVIDKAERDFITRDLRSVSSQLGITMHDAISADVEGHRQTMVLVYLPHLAEWWSKEPVSREDAAASLLLGATTVRQVSRGTDGADYVIVDTEQVASALTQLPIWTPELRMERQVVVRYLNEMSRLA